MKASLHGHDIDTAESSEDEFAGMSLNGGYREVGDFAVREFVLVSYF